LGFGYLLDPNARYGHIYNPDVETFESIARFPCLVLLGEPGMGKSRTLKTEYDVVHSRIEEQGGRLPLFLDLRACGPGGMVWRSGPTLRDVPATLPARKAQPANAPLQVPDMPSAFSRYSER
jgi:hypothetical protein